MALLPGYRRYLPHAAAFLVGAGCMLLIMLALGSAGEQDRTGAAVGYVVSVAAGAAAARATRSASEAREAARAVDAVPTEEEARAGLGGKTPDQLASEVDRLTGG